jgi:hypothetical protein
MIDNIVNLLFRWERLRKALFDEVRMYDHLDSIMKDPEAMEIASCHWKEGDTWYGWTHDKEMNRYYFDDVGSKSFSELLDRSGEL